MFELTVIACLITQPARCETFQMPFQQPMAMTQCMVQAQFRLVEWLAEHPDWSVRRWTCGLPRT